MQDNQQSALIRYLEDVALFRGMMEQLANSIEVVLDDILEKSGIRLPKTLGGKISRFKASKSKFNVYHGSIDDLLEKLGFC